MNREGGTSTHTLSTRDPLFVTVDRDAQPLPRSDFCYYSMTLPYAANLVETEGAEKERERDRQTDKQTNRETEKGGRGERDRERGEGVDRK